MINYLFICKSKHWPARMKKIQSIMRRILIFKKELNFREDINYRCNIILTDNKLTKQMNFKYRKKQYPTDVLTFVSDINLNKNKKQKICDIFLSAEIIKKDSMMNKITFYDHLAHLIIHSFLHINGHIHNKTNDFKIMKNIEIKVLKKMEIDDPYSYN